MSERPISQALENYKRIRRVRCHTPGHGGHNTVGQLSAAHDVTEIDGMDSLYHANGILLDAEQRAARLMGAGASLISAGGCTLCIQTMLALAVPQGGTVIMGRNAHQSAVHAAVLLDITPVWIVPQQGRIDPSAVVHMLKEHPHARAVYITSPDYFGRLSDVAGIAAVCARQGVLLLVDNAHGTHLFLLDQGLDPLAAGASMAAYSAHKTLPVLTGGAWLNLADGRLYERAKRAMAVFGSTSPSYLIMQSLDNARSWCETDGRGAFERLRLWADDIRRVAAMAGLPSIDGPCDPVRLAFDTGRAGWFGQEAAAYFRQSGVEPEYADETGIVLLLSPLMTDQELKTVERAVRGFVPRSPAVRKDEADFPLLPPAVLSLREALLHRQYENLPVSQAQGRIAAEAASPCPPGIPVVMPGEEITPQVARFLQRRGVTNLDVCTANG